MSKNKMHPKTEFIIAITFTVILAAAAPLAAFWAKAVWDKWSKITSVSTGKISGKILNEENPYIVNVGSNFHYLTAEKLKEGFNISKLFGASDDIKNSITAKMYEENNRLLFDINITDDGKSVLKVIANEFEFNPGEFDCNYNFNGIEVVDKKLIPVIQIYLKENNKIYIGGNFKTNYGTMLVTTKGTMTNPSNQQLVEYAKPLFKYPSFQHREAVEEKNLPDFAEIDKRMSEEKARVLEKEDRKVKINEYSKLRRSELKTKALELADSIDELQNKYFSKSTLEKARFSDPSLETPHKLLSAEFNSKYKTEALALYEVIRNELLKQNPKLAISSPGAVEWRIKEPTLFYEMSESLRQLADALN